MNKEQCIKELQTMKRQTELAIDHFRLRYETALSTTHNQDDVNDLYYYVIENRREICRLQKELNVFSFCLLDLENNGENK